MDLSIIIVNYNTQQMLRRCLQSVFASVTDYQYEVIVSDNGSTDGSIEMVAREFRQARLIANQANLGFSKGNNVAIRQSAGRYVLLLNSDTAVRADALDLCLKKMDSDSSIGALGCKVLLPDGRLDAACRRNFPNPWNSFLRLFGLKKFSNYNVQGSIDQESEVDAVMGAYMMVRKSVIGHIGLLDENFFMYGEDLDWCWRIKAAGYKVWYYPAAAITHYKYGSSQLIPRRVMIWAHAAMKIFYQKHYAAEHSWIFNQLVYFGINVRMMLVMFVNLFRSKKSVH